MTIERIGAAPGSAVEEQPSALACAEPHPLAPECLCRRLGGHRGGHTFDGLPDWADTNREETP